MKENERKSLTKQPPMNWIGSVLQSGCTKIMTCWKGIVNHCYSGARGVHPVKWFGVPKTTNGQRSELRVRWNKHNNTSSSRSLLTIILCSYQGYQ